MDKNKQLKSKLDQLERRINECRVQYELFFNGVEKKEPYREKENIKREIRSLQMQVKSSVDRFRLRTLNSRFSSYSQYWERVKYQREQGNYQRDRQRARRRLGLSVTTKEGVTTEHAPSQEAKERPAAYTIEDLMNPDLKQNQAPREKVGPSTGIANGPSEERLQQIYQNFVNSKQQHNESSNVSFDSMKRKLARQVTKLEEKGYKNIDFRVVTRDGKTSLKAVGKKVDS
ncbi:MAG TPA: hypothetical protein DCE42_11490 [Myxococcales bacterium]|nr:hypothetical protein [Deltaproteobacteria bacterium]HAA55373.1 hypothetical protein [Myxococcales bacterium]|tara:strand:+ start:3690 stop:4379 length:690 start_codon:yes stop_codon:yes gene_type:complete